MKGKPWSLSSSKAPKVIWQPTSCAAQRVRKDRNCKIHPLLRQGVATLRRELKPEPHKPHSIPSSFHFFSTSALVFSSIRISSGQGRVNPSVGHLRVASIPILEPKFAVRAEWSRESTGPRVN